MGHVHYGGAFDPWLALVLSLAGVGTAGLAGVGLAVFVRRRSRSYLLVALALVALFARSLLAAASLTGVVDSNVHHLFEHLLDGVLVALVVGAVYYARSVEPGVDDVTAAEDGEDDRD